MEVIRFAAANRLCIELGYDRRRRMIEPYSLRRTQDGHLLLHAVKHETGEPRSYRVDRIESATPTGIAFVPKFAIELTPSGPLMALPGVRHSTVRSTGETRKRRSVGKARTHRSGLGRRYIVQCSYCGKKFTRKEYGTSLNPHKGKYGYPCPRRTGFPVKTEY